MAVQPQTPYKEYTANGSTKSFALEFDCDNQDHLIVLVDDVEAIVGTWSLSNGAVVFGNAPATGKKITVQRNTPFRRDGDFQSYDNSFRPGPVNKGFDWIWLKLQELGVADWILSTRINDLRAYVERQDSILQENIDNLKTYVDDRDDELRAYLLEEIRKQGVALDQLEEYYSYLMQQLAQVAIDRGWAASFIVSADGSTQQEINDFGGAKWRNKPLGYDIGSTVKLDNGDIMKSTIDGNTNDPNVDMTGWVKVNSASQIFDESGKTQQEINDLQKLKNDNLESVKDYGAIGDGTLHTVNEWTVLGSKIYYPSLAAMQVDYPHVTSLTDSIDWAAAQKSINETNIAYYPKSLGAYINNKTLQLNGNWDSVAGASKQVVIKNIGSGLPALRLTKAFQSIKNISIWGDGGGFGVGATTGHGIHLNNGTLTNFHVVSSRYHGGPGVSGSGGVWITKIVQCYIEHNLQDGINLVSPSGATLDQIGNALSITESVISANTGNGLNWKAVALNVTGSNIEGNKGFGVLVDTTPHTASAFGVNITGNYTENNVLGEIKLKCKTYAIVTDINIVGNYFYSIQTGGAVAAITFEGEYRTFRNVNICSNGLVTGGTVVNLVDGGNSLREDCTINLGAYSGIKLARAKLVSAIKSKVIFGKAHCIGANWVDLYTSENIFSATAKTLYFDLPLESGVALDKVEFLMSTNATNQYNVIATLYSTDPLTNAAPIEVYSATLQSNADGGNKVFAFTTLQSNNPVRLALGVRYHLRFVISSMTTGSIVTIGNPIARYI